MIGSMAATAGRECEGSGDAIIGWPARRGACRAEVRVNQLGSACTQSAEHCFAVAFWLRERLRKRRRSQTRRSLMRDRGLAMWALAIDARARSDGGGFSELVSVGVKVLAIDARARSDGGPCCSFTRARMGVLAIDARARSDGGLFSPRLVDRPATARDRCAGAKRWRVFGGPRRRAELRHSRSMRGREAMAGRCVNSRRST